MMAKYSVTRTGGQSNTSQVKSLVIDTWGYDVTAQYPSQMMNREFFSVPPGSIIKQAPLVFSVTQDQYKNSAFWNNPALIQIIVLHEGLGLLNF